MDKSAPVRDQPPHYETISSGPQAYPTPQQQPYPQPYGTSQQQQYPQQPPPNTYPEYTQQHPQPGAPYPPPGYAPNYGATHVTNVIVPNTIVATGDCPRCRIGNLEKHFTCLGILCAIFVFPIGIICCLAFTQETCSNCGATFDSN